MRNTSKMTTLENKFPLLAVEHGCIISKDADITVAFEVELPELYTVTGAEYEAIHGCWCKAIKVLPYFCVVHKQDWFIKEKYMPELQKDDMSFLSRSFERHFNERPYLKHSCYLYLTKTTKERNRMQSNFSTLCRGHIIPKELDKETAGKFMEAAEQFERIMNDSGFVRLRRLSTDEIVGTEKSAGLIERYFSLMPEGDTTLQDIDLSAKEMRIGDNRLCLHTLSDAEDMPGKVATDIRYEKLSTDRSDCRLSFASPVGLLLSCNHIYNQYVIIDNSEENLQKFEKSARNMQSLSRYSRSNSINREWIDQYLNEAHSYGLTSVRAHFNVMAWSDDAEELKHIKNDVGSQLASMECVPHHNTIDCPTLYWAAMPGNAADFPAEESFHTFIEQAVCLFTEETNYRSSLSPFGIKMVDRLTGKPLHLDISDLPMKRGITTNRNKFVLGPSGSGKSTAARLAARFWDIQSGKITLGGQDISRIDPETLLTNYSVVFQEVVLFNASIMDNIRIGKRDATDEEVRRVARLAQCDEFVTKMPQGYQTIIGENGETLSGGERQRISIARALLKDAPIVLLDEATASLDVENETKIQAGISELVRNKTVLIIVHRMRTVANADKIVVLENGSVAEMGTPEELKKKNGIFARMVNRQVTNMNG